MRRSRSASFSSAAGSTCSGYDLVHGDVKPENVLVLRSYDAVDFRLVDFGSVTELFSITSRAGTASYLAPERFHEAPISERTEIFAIGVTLYEALTGALSVRRNRALPDAALSARRKTRCG